MVSDERNETRTTRRKRKAKPFIDRRRILSAYFPYNGANSESNATVSQYTLMCIGMADIAEDGDKIGFVL